MTLFPRTVFIALAVLAFNAGCSGGGIPVPDGGGKKDAGGDCFEDIDCPDPKLFFCNTTTSKCEPSCRVKADCTAAVRGQHALAFCASGLGCECDEGKCTGSLCSADVDCGGQVCRSGACVDAPAASTVATCAVIPDYVVLKQGEKAKFWVSAWDASKNPVVVKTGISWSAVSATVSVPASSTGASAEFTGGTPNAMAEQAVKATVGTKECFAKVVVLPSTAPAAGTVTVIVTDELTGRPIPGADILASVPATGTAIGAAVPTAATGLATVPGLPVTGTVTVTAFHADYNYLTVANYDMAGSRFLSLVLRRNQVDKYGGYKGTFKNVPPTSNIHAGIAGASLAGSITDLSFSQLLGPTIPTRVKIGTAIDQMNVPLPAGIFLGFTEVIKGEVSAQGLAGTCVNASGAPDEASINAGTCGTRTAWGLAGDVPLGDLPIDAVAGGLNNIDFGKVLSRIIPIFKKFNSSIVRDVQFTLKPTPKDANGKYRFSEADGGLPDFTVVDHNFYQAGVASKTEVPLAFNTVVKIPDLPKFKATYVDAAVLLGGAIVPGRGVVPLGIGAAVNTTPADAKTDIQSELAAGLATLRMSPTHHGIEGSAYGIVALGVSLKSVTDASAGLATSAIFSRVKDNVLKFDPKGATPIDIGTAFPGFPESAKYNYTDSDTLMPGLLHRTFKFTNAADSGAAGSSVTRVVFTNEADHRWVVYLDPSQGTSGFCLPKPSGAHLDRTFFTPMVTGARSPFLVQQIRLNENPALATGAAITFNKLVELNSTNGDRLVDFTTGFSLVDYDRPNITWKTPATGGTAVAKGSQVVVVVKAFKVGSAATDDGFVRLSITPANASCPDVDVKTDASMGKGEIAITIPAACNVGAATMTATLMSNATPTAPIQPPVSSAQTATIQ